VRFATNGTNLGTQGFWFDQVEITNPQSCDSQTNVCAAIPAEVSPDGGPVPFTVQKTGPTYALRFSEVPGATRYNVYAGTLTSLRAHAYDHAAAGEICSIVDGAGGDGQVSLSVPTSAFAAGSYLLAVAQNPGGESVYGHASNGMPIPAAPTTCP
jgi:hypothetical protein